MKLVADEGVDGPIIVALRNAGYEVRYFAEEGAGSEDSAVLSASDEPGTLLLTCDKDFGELVFRQRLSSAGVVLIRLAGLAADTKATVIARPRHDRGEEMRGAFSVITPGLLRIRRRQ
jgi:predicted nuclease of predicted toxin-antitoxin system